MWGSPLSKAGSDRVKQTAKPPKEPKELEKFKQPPLKLTKGEAKKILAYKGQISLAQILWCQMFLEQKAQESSYPPQIYGKDAFGMINAFLPKETALSLLENVRSEFQKTLPFLESESRGLSGESEAYPLHQSLLPLAVRNSLTRTSSL